VALLKANKFDELAKSVPNRIADLLDCEPIESLIRHSGKDGVQAYLECEIIKLAANFNGNPALNIKAYQVPMIAEQLLENYKWESIEDFTLCFRKASAGMYGEIYRIDGAVIGQWFSRYLDEKYDALEQRKAKEKHPDKTADFSKIAKEQAEKYGPGTDYYKEAQRIAENLINTPKAPNDNSSENAYQRHKLEARHPVTTPEELERKQLHIDYIRANYHPDGSKKEGWQEENEWLTVTAKSRRK
jgi:hypothetical protein